ncbi:MAG: outer membrane lipoprotein carrier protein LolA [Prevotellaceae bacterium]|jgi:outer membrane lipoprotein-sorting protein|nr:outer membrane lipoprotein carrier protein LolA [Prevotellaceae bacterium]
MKQIFTLLFVTIACMAMHAQVSSDADRRIVQAIKQSNSAYHTITSSFQQTRHLSMLGENTTSGGRFYYRKPEQLAMKYTQPEGDLLLINGNQFVMVAAGKEKKLSSKSAKMEGMKIILSACLQGDAEQMGAEKIACSENTNYYMVIADINGKLNRSGISRVIASYAKTDGTLATLQTIEADGSYTLYELTDKKFNQPIEEEIFSNKN